MGRGSARGEEGLVPGPGLRPQCLWERHLGWRALAWLLEVLPPLILLVF